MLLLLFALLLLFSVGVPLGGFRFPVSGPAPGALLSWPSRRSRLKRGSVALSAQAASGSAFRCRAPFPAFRCVEHHQFEHSKPVAAMVRPPLRPPSLGRVFLFEGVSFVGAAAPWSARNSLAHDSARHRPASMILGLAFFFVRNSVCGAAARAPRERQAPREQAPREQPVHSGIRCHFVPSSVFVKLFALLWCLAPFSCVALW